MCYRMSWLLLAVSVAFACGGRRETAGAQQPVSSQSVEVREPLRPEPPPRPPEIYFGEGDCAPTLAPGLKGTCINGRPCNGFGFRNEKGAWECGCYTTKGGCPDGTACSPRTRSCMKVAEIDIPRPRAR
jgi:hypothetical protein